MRHYNRCHGNRKVITGYLEQSFSLKIVEVCSLPRQNYEKKLYYWNRSSKEIKLGLKTKQQNPPNRKPQDELALLS